MRDTEMLIQELNRPRLTFAVDANCLGVDPDLFFPQRGESTGQAKRVCAGCKVRVECLEFALAHHEKFGIWGGKSERERRRMRRDRKQLQLKSA